MRVVPSNLSCLAVSQYSLNVFTIKAGKPWLHIPEDSLVMLREMGNF